MPLSLWLMTLLLRRLKECDWKHTAERMRFISHSNSRESIVKANVVWTFKSTGGGHVLLILLPVCNTSLLHSAAEFAMRSIIEEECTKNQFMSTTDRPRGKRDTPAFLSKGKFERMGKTKNTMHLGRPNINQNNLFVRSWAIAIQIQIAPNHSLRQYLHYPDPMNGYLSCEVDHTLRYLGDRAWLKYFLTSSEQQSQIISLNRTIAEFTPWIAATYSTAMSWLLSVVNSLKVLHMASCWHCQAQ